MKTTREDESRRQFLAKTVSIAGAMAVATTAGAVPVVPGSSYTPPDIDNYDFLLARICNNNPDWDFAPGGDKNFLEQLGEVLRVKVKIQDNARDLSPENGRAEHFNALVDLNSYDEMRKFPMLFMMGTGAFRIGPAQIENLKQYVLGGGSILMDECASPRRADDFYNSAYASLLSMFGPDNVRPIPEDHEVYSNVYDISQPNFHRWERGANRSPGNKGAFVGDRLAVFLTDADIHCGWTDPHDSWEKRANHREGIMTGINVTAYFLSH